MMRQLILLGLAVVAVVRAQEDEMPEEFTPEEIARIYKTFDKDGNGLLNKEEFTTWLKDDIKEKYGEMDEESRVELEKLDEADFEESANDFLEQGDKNKDGGLSQDEFKAVLSPDFDDEMGGGGEFGGYADEGH